MTDKLYGGIEGGGTKFICAVSDENLKIIDKIEIPTTSPEETLDRVCQYFSDKKLHSLGVGCFGPIQLDRHHENYGTITAAAKIGWSEVNIIRVLSQKISAPISLSTDVNCAALAEHSLGAGTNCSNILYITVGTGIGGANIISGKLLSGLSHQEIGHMIVPRQQADEKFAGTCAYHQSCLEGLACGPALQKRWGEQPEDLPASHQAWQLETYYLAVAISNLINITKPERIILGGGVMNHHDNLINDIRALVLKNLNGYLALPQIIQSIDRYIVPPQLGSLSGVSGALLLAIEQPPIEI